MARSVYAPQHADMLRAIYANLDAAAVPPILIPPKGNGE
jgi:hypothetical protein